MTLLEYFFDAITMTNLIKIHTASCDSYQVKETYLVDSISVEHDLFQTHYEILLSCIDLDSSVDQWSYVQ